MAQQKTKTSNHLSATIENRSARYNYEILERYTVGIVLYGPEVTAIRAGKASLVDSYCYVDNNGEMIITNMHVTINQNTIFSSIDEDRDRKLLLNKKEISDLQKELTKPGITLVPLTLYRAKSGYYKLSLGLARGKKDYDKRETIKARDTKKDMERALKTY